jgi:NAD(P)-dependent dehydrogenase (short-subunit alcohol dehydrogenase family)
MSLALVSGASRGIGREIALALADAGHTVIAVSRKPNPDESHPKIKSIAGDISDESANINGQFLWIENPLQAPIASWDKPIESPPWL